jgi:hypothetical protein
MLPLQMLCMTWHSNRTLLGPGLLPLAQPCCMLPLPLLVASLLVSFLITG